MIHLLKRRAQMAEIVAMTRPRCALPWALRIICIFVFIDVNDRVCPEIDRIRTGGKTAVKHLGIEDLCGQGFPSSGRTAIRETRPPLADPAELLFNMRD